MCAEKAHDEDFVVVATRAMMTAAARAFHNQC
jgi:hypothetical protein